MSRREKSQKEILTACARYAQMLLLLMIIWDVLCVVYGIGVGKSGAYIGAHGARVLTLILVRCAFTSAEVIIWLLCDIAEQRTVHSTMPESAFPAASSRAQTEPAQGERAATQASRAVHRSQDEEDAYQIAQRLRSTGSGSASQSAPGTYSAQGEADIYRMSQRGSSTGAQSVQGFINDKS